MTPDSELARAISGRKERFHFLPGIRAAFAYAGGFDASHLATLKMSAIGEPDIVVSPPIGPANVSRPEASDYDLHPDKPYRITVAVDGVDLGFAELGTLANRCTLNHVETGKPLALDDGWVALADQIAWRKGLWARRFVYRPSGDVLYLRYFVFGGRVLVGLLLRPASQ